MFIRNIIYYILYILYLIKIDFLLLTAENIHKYQFIKHKQLKYINKILSIDILEDIKNGHIYWLNYDKSIITINKDKDKDKKFIVINNNIINDIKIYLYKNELYKKLYVIQKTYLLYDYNKNITVKYNNVKKNKYICITNNITNLQKYIYSCKHKEIQKKIFSKNIYLYYFYYDYELFKKVLYFGNNIYYSSNIYYANYKIYFIHFNKIKKKYYEMLAKINFFNYKILDIILMQH